MGVSRLKMGLMIKTVGEMTIVGEPPEPFAKALRVISQRLHMPMNGWPADSKSGCILSSLTTRDFLRLCGFKAEARSVCTAIESRRDGEVFYTCVIGRPGSEKRPGLWAGHMVTYVTTDDADWIIDTTLFPHITKEWGNVNGMLAIPSARTQHIEPNSGMPIVGGLRTGGFMILYLDFATNTSWEGLPHALNTDAHQTKARRMFNAM